MELIKAKKKFGQNFLIDKNISFKIVESLEINDNDIIIEIGPGTGALTQFLIKKNCKTYAIELDKEAINILNKQFNSYINQNLFIINSDILKFNFKEIISNNKLKIIGNIPYYLTSELLFKIFENSELFEKVILMVQKEIAQRLVAKKSTKDYGILTVAMELLGNCRKLFDVSPSCFIPKPNVMSSVIEINFNTNNLNKDKFNKVMGLIRAAFNQRRKTLRNSLSSFINSKLHISIDEFIQSQEVNIKYYFTRRAEELSSLDFIILYDLIVSFKSEIK